MLKPSPTVRRQTLSSVRIDKAQMTITALPLSAVIAMAFHVHPGQVAGPEWLTSTAFNITAKIPAGVAVDQVPAMLQSLLTERFHLAVHREDRNQAVYALVVAKGGIRFKEVSAPAEEPEPTGDQSVQTPVGEMKMSGSGASRELSGSGVRMKVAGAGMHIEVSQTAKLAALLGADADRPVLDKTELKGSYQIGFDILDGASCSSAGAGASQIGMAPDPGTCNPEFDAVERQLGLRVEPQKASIPIIIIDRMDKTPTEN